MDTNEKDWLKTLFSRLPEEELPDSFRENMMKRIIAETARKKKQNERLGLLSVILASLAIIGLAVAALKWFDVPQIEWRMYDLSSMPFYLYIGALALLLLSIDHFCRVAYRKKHP